MGQGSVWKGRYKGRLVDGTESQCQSEEEARDSFTPLQLDVFHALWETYHGSGVPGKTDFDDNAEGKRWDRPQTCVDTVPRGDRDVEGIRGC